MLPAGSSPERETAAEYGALSLEARAERVAELLAVGAARKAAAEGEQAHGLP